MLPLYSSCACAGPYFRSRQDTFARQFLFECFEANMSPAQARIHLDEELILLARNLTRHESDPQRMVDMHVRLLRDVQYRPTPRQVGRLRDWWRSRTQTGETIEGLAPFDAAMKAAKDWEAAERKKLQEFRAEVGDVGWGADGVYLDGNRWALILVPPIAARLHCAAPQSAEVCFADATSSLTTTSEKIVCIYTSACRSAFPLGYIMLSASDGELVTAALSTYAKLLGSVPNSRAFFTGEMNSQTGLLAGPKLFMSDCDQTFKNAWRAVFPRSQHLLCHWHLFRAAWQKLQALTKDNDKLGDIFSNFKSMVYAGSEQEYAATHSQLRAACEQHNTMDFWYYLEGQWFAKQSEWVLYRRQRMEGWRGHNTNNVCESQFAVIKDFVFARRRTSSFPLFIRQVCHTLQAWYRTIFFDRVADTARHGKGSVAKHRRLFFRGLPEYPKADRSACQLLNPTIPLFSVRSATKADLFYTVNLSTGLCQCTRGMSGSPCKHQVLAWQRYIDSLSSEEERIQAPCPFMYPVWTDEDRDLFYFLATGNRMGNSSAVIRQIQRCRASAQELDRKFAVQEASASGTIDNDDNGALSECDSLASDDSDYAPHGPEADLADDALPAFDDPAPAGAHAADGAAQPIQSAAPARPLADETEALLRRAIDFLEQTCQMLRHVPDNQHDDTHKIYQAMLRFAAVSANWTYSQRATHLAQFREPSDLLDRTNIPYHGRDMSQKKRKRKHGDASTGHGQCTNRGGGARRRRTEPDEEEPVDLPKEIPQEWLAPLVEPASQSSYHPSTRSTRARSRRLADAAAPAAAAAPAPPFNPPRAMPMPAPSTQTAAPIVEISDEELTALVARLYGRGP